MSGKRRDYKNRILNKGETQRKDGMYEYKYTDAFGHRRSVYSWRLVETDPTPSGKERQPALRTLEREAQKSCDVGINTAEAGKYTLNECFEKAILLKSIKEQTKNQYISVYNNNIRNKIGDMKIKQITRDVIYKYLDNLLKGQEISKSHLNTILILIRMTLKYCVDNDLIAKNTCPTIGDVPKYSSIKKKKKRPALSIEAQKRFLHFLDEDIYAQKHKNLIIVLLGTGCRISEAIALTRSDCDFDADAISINHSIWKAISADGKYILKISDTKTEASERILPMISGVKEALLDEIERNKWIPSVTIDGYSDFIFKTCYGNPVRRDAVDHAIKGIIQRYNKREKAEAERENREPELLPHFSVHSLRHTFATRVYEAEKDPNMIKDLLGHESVSTSMDVYTDTDINRTKSVLQKAEGRLIKTG